MDLSKFSPGDEVYTVDTGEVTHAVLVRYSGASGDFNPIHTDPAFAESVDLPGTIAHGMYVMAQLGKVATKIATPDRLRQWIVTFKDMTQLGEHLICGATMKSQEDSSGEIVATLSLQAANANGAIKATGELTVAV